MHKIARRCGHTQVHSIRMGVHARGWCLAAGEGTLEDAPSAPGAAPQVRMRGPMSTPRALQGTVQLLAREADGLLAILHHSCELYSKRIV